MAFCPQSLISSFEDIISSTIAQVAVALENEAAEKAELASSNKARKAAKRPRNGLCVADELPGSSSISAEEPLLPANALGMTPSDAGRSASGRTAGRVSGSASQTALNRTARKSRGTALGLTPGSAIGSMQHRTSISTPPLWQGLADSSTSNLDTPLPLFAAGSSYRLSRCHNPGHGSVHPDRVPTLTRQGELLMSGLGMALPNLGTKEVQAMPAASWELLSAVLKVRIPV